MEIILGAAVSLLTQAIKKYLGTDTFGTLFTVLVLSLVGGWIYFVLEGTEAWMHILQIIAYAGSIYTFLIRRFE
jgi:hypothetical protein